MSIDHKNGQNIILIYTGVALCFNNQLNLCIQVTEMGKLLTVVDLFGSSHISCALFFSY